MVLGKLSVPRRSPNLDIIRARAIALAEETGGGGVVLTFVLLSKFSLLFLLLWETARYRLKYCLKRTFNPKQPTNQPNRETFIICIQMS